MDLGLKGLRALVTGANLLVDGALTRGVQF